MSSSISFAAGGIDVAQMVTDLMAVERQPLNVLRTRQAAATTQTTSIATIKLGVESLRASSASIISGGLAKLSVATSGSAVSASISSAARAGSVSFTVDRLASTHGLRTSGTVASSSAVVTSASTLAVSATAAHVGATALNAGAGVSPGRYTVSVLQATAGATITGPSALAASTVIDGTNNTLNIAIDGVAHTLTIAGGTYSRNDLVTAVQNAIVASGSAATATLDASNHLKITTAHEGSTASLGFSGGNAIAALGLAVTMPAVVGIDGSIKIGTNPAVTVTSAGQGEVVAVSTGTGNLNVTLGGGLRVGDATVAVVSTGDRSLSAVAAAINTANVGVSASSVKVTDGAWLMQLSSTRSGTASAISIDAGAFSIAGGLIETSAALDAKITIGAGAGAYSVTAAGNTFSDVLQGATITANALSATPVSVTVSRDNSATADAVDKLISQANGLITQAAIQTQYNKTNKTVAPLAGDYVVRTLAADIRAAITATIGGGTVGLASNVGVDVQRDGTLKFDRAKFLDKLSSDPDGMEKLFSRHGTGAAGITFANASDNTLAGSYAVAVTQSATRGTTGEVLVGGSLAGQVIGVRIGATVANFSAAPGASAADIVAGLNDALAKAGLKVNAEVTVGGGVKLTGTVYGGAGAFDSNLDTAGVGSWATNAGTDVIGTIDGQAAVGIGQRLKLLDIGTGSTRGLEIDIDEAVTGALGNIDYQPGIAARLVNLGSRLTASNGGLTTSASTYDGKIKAFNDQIDKFQARLLTTEANLRRQWTTVQQSLQSLQNQQNWLAGQVASLSASK